LARLRTSMLTFTGTPLTPRPKYAITFTKR
jgi:hypothetical protein